MALIFKEILEKEIGCLTLKEIPTEVVANFDRICLDLEMSEAGRIECINRIFDYRNISSGLLLKTAEQELTYYDLHSMLKIHRGPSRFKLLELKRDSSLFFTNPELFIDSIYEFTAQRRVFSAIYPASVDDTFLQIGGHGSHVLRHLVLGKGLGILLTPSLGEALVATALAYELGVLQNFIVLLGYAESIPIKDNKIGLVYFGGSLHHTNLSSSLPESLRVLKVEDGSVFAIEAVEVFGYRIGVRLFGKREREVMCQILRKRDIENISQTFRNVRLTRGGVFARYLLLALSKIGISVPQSISFHVQSIFDNVAPKFIKNFLGSWVLIEIKKTQAENISNPIHNA